LEDLKLILGMTKLIREDFLQQKAFMAYDNRCLLEMTSKIMVFEDARTPLRGKNLLTKAPGHPKAKNSL